MDSSFSSMQRGEKKDTVPASPINFGGIKGIGNTLEKKKVLLRKKKSSSTTDLHAVRKPSVRNVALVEGEWMSLSDGSMKPQKQQDDVCSSPTNIRSCNYSNDSVSDNEEVGELPSLGAKSNLIQQKFSLTRAR